MAVIVAATLASVVVGSVLITLFDPEEFPDLGTGCGGRLPSAATRHDRDGGCRGGSWLPGPTTIAQ
jgi:hypothetical protein